MAQTKRKRRTKHRGNAAGIVEARGRTGRKPNADERKPSKREEAKGRREERMNRPPTWKAAAQRAALAAVFMAVVLLFIARGNVVAVLVPAVIAMALYVPLGYYTDLWIYNRRQRKKA